MGHIAFCYLVGLSNYHLLLMKTLKKLFETEVDHLLEIENIIDCRVSPDRLLRELKNGSVVRKLVKYMESSSTNPFKYIKLLSLCNLLMIYSKDWFQFIEENLKLRVCKDQWLNAKFIEPYYRFIIRCCTSRDQYSLAKSGYSRKGEAMQGLFYSINMLKHLFQIVQKMPFLGRYYKSSYNAVVSSAVEIIALQAQKLYGFFKSCLTQILYRREYYIKNKDDELIMRGVFADQLTIINEEMKKLFLDKYFYPLGRGIGVKLFRPEEQSPQFEKTINAIVNNHQDTERMRQHENLEKTLFPESGLVNWNFYQQTLLGNPLSQTIHGQTSTFKGVEELVLSEDEQMEVAQELPIKCEKDKKISDKETNSGSVQFKGNQM